MSMLNTEFHGKPYHGWIVEVVSHNNRFSFRCYCPELEGFHDDGTTYPSYRSALVAGYQFIDRETALAALMGVLEELMRDDKISLEEYWNLVNFC
jgi:hypothetical protein